MLQFNGMPIIVSDHMVKTVEDWSRVRSPSRARRRLKRGFKQNIVVQTVPRTDVVVFDGKMIMHPSLLPTLKATSTR